MSIQSVTSQGSAVSYSSNSMQSQNKNATTVEKTVVEAAQFGSKPKVNNSQTDDGYSGFSDKEDDNSQVQGEGATSEKIKSVVDDLNKQISTLHNTQCSFKYHDDTNRISITVYDKDTQEVIKEIPPEKTLEMIAKAWELAGLFVDEKR